VEEVVTGEAVVLDLPCARFPTRTLAHLIDMVVQVPALIVVAVAAMAMPDDASAAAVWASGYVLVLVGYPVLSETLSRGRTLGKLALGLRVAGDDGGPLRFRQALVRALAGAVECWMLIGVPALITSLLSAHGKRLGDIFAGTFVLRERAPAPVAMPTPMSDPALAGWAASLDLSALPEPLAASAASYLSRYWQLHPAARDQLGWQLAADISARVSPSPPPGLPPVAYLGAVLAERYNRELRRYAPPPAAPAPQAPYAVPAPYAAPAPRESPVPRESPAPGSSPAPLPPDIGFTPPG
jgi:uncharacterized RDD family membrane protein YckC